MKKFSALSTLMLAALAATSAQAHLSYGSGTTRNFGTLAAGSSATKSGTVASNYGWADASDLSLSFDSVLATTARLDESSPLGQDGADNLLLGDSHKARAFRLHLDTALNVTFSASASSGLTSAFSVYQGLAAISPFTAPQASADYDFNAAAQAWRTTYAQSHAGASYNHLATIGSWNALGDFAMAGDGDPAGVASALSFFTYMGSAFSTVANGTATTTLTLGPGDYTVLVGGNDISAKSAANFGTNYAFNLTVSAAAVPEPQRLAMTLMGLVFVGALHLRRKQA